MKQSKIQKLPASTVSAIVNSIESTLKGSAKPTKKQALNELVKRNLCSVTSDKSLKTFLKHAQDQNVGIPQAFASLMGVPVTAVANRASRPSTTAPAATPTKTEGTGKSKTSKTVDVAVSLKGISLLKVKEGKGKASFPDGSVISVGGIDERELRLSSTVLEFTASA